MRLKFSAGLCTSLSLVKYKTNNESSFSTNTVASLVLRMRTVHCGVKSTRKTKIITFRKQFRKSQVYPDKLWGKAVEAAGAASCLVYGCPVESAHFPKVKGGRYIKSQATYIVQWNEQLATGWEFCWQYFYDYRCYGYPDIFPCLWHPEVRQLKLQLPAPDDLCLRVFSSHWSLLGHQHRPEIQRNEQTAGVELTPVNYRNWNINTPASSPLVG